ncbi:MAG TPA: dienelactone hydrolase family protein [Thermoplasmata archaeon]|nr:dienelactone hydrolase family protein [Thermoplasmata archaeon]
MRDDDRMLDLPEEFGSGIVGVCDICGTRQAVIILQKERYKLCVLDFLNKTWLQSEKKPGAPAPLYRSDRIWFETRTVPEGKAPAIVLTPTKIVKHPVVLITPDVFGITTTLLDAAIRFAREGCEVMIPDLGKTGGIGPAHHLALRTGRQFRGGVSPRSKRVLTLVNLYADALSALRAREMVDATKSAVFGVSYGGSLALAVAAEDTRLAAVVLAYPQPVSPAGLPKLVTAPILYVGGTDDRSAARARAQLAAARGTRGVSIELDDVAGARHGFLARDLGAYDLARAEAAWARILGFVKQQLLPPPPKPPVPPTVSAAAVLPRPPAPSAAAPAPPASATSAPPTTAPRSI